MLEKNSKSPLSLNLSIYSKNSFTTRIKAVVANVPSPYRWGGNVEPDSSGKLSAAWTFKGVSLPFLSYVGDLEPVTLSDGTHAKANRPAFERGIKAASDLESTFSSIEKTNGPILLLGAEDDQVWPSCDFAKAAMDRLKTKKHAFEDELVCFKNAGHSATMLPGFSTMALAHFHPHMQVMLAVGGTPEANAAAQRASWNKTLSFLRKTFDSK